MWTATVCVSFWVQNPAGMGVEVIQCLVLFSGNMAFFLAGFQIGNLFLVVLPPQDNGSVYGQIFLRMSRPCSGSVHHQFLKSFYDAWVGICCFSSASCWSTMLLAIGFSPLLDPCTYRNILVLTGLSCSRSLYVGGSFFRVLVIVAVAFHTSNALVF